jgi:hypothetical protein
MFLTLEFATFSAEKAVGLIKFFFLAGDFNRFLL